MPDVINDNTLTHDIVKKAFDALTITSVGQNIFASIVIEVDFLLSFFYILFF